MSFYKELTLFLQSNVLFSIAIILVVGNIFAVLFKKIKCPQVVGYLFSGVVLGPSCLGILSDAKIESFLPFSYFALGLIGFSIGGELNRDVIKKYGKQFTPILFLEALTAFFLVSVLATGVSYLFYHSIPKSLALGLVLGSISSATAAAGTTDVIWEYKSRGPLTSTLMGIVALDDILALVLFSISAGVAGVLLGSGDSSTLKALGNTSLEMVLSIGIGVVAGFIFSQIGKKVRQEDKLFSYSLTLVLFTLGVASLFKLDMILAIMVSGIVLVYSVPKKGKEIFKLFEKSGSALYILFFALVGAGFKIQNFTLIGVALLSVYLLGRTAGKMAGATLGAIIGKAPKSVIKYLPMSLFSQSGVAIGLSLAADEKFRGYFGGIILTVVTTSTFIVQFVGPFFVKKALVKSGEAGLSITQEDIMKQTVVSDVTDTSVPVIKENDILSKVLDTFSQHERFSFPVVRRSGTVSGVISLQTLKNAFMVSDLSDVIIAIDLMDTRFPVCGTQTQLSDAVTLIDNSVVDYAVVLDEKKKLVGVVEKGDISRYLQKKEFELNTRLEQLS